MSALTFRFATVVALLLGLAGSSFAGSTSANWAKPAPTAAQRASWAKMSQIAKARPRNALGQWLPKADAQK